MRPLALSKVRCQLTCGTGQAGMDQSVEGRAPQPLCLPRNPPPWPAGQLVLAGPGSQLQSSLRTRAPLSAYRCRHPRLCAAAPNAASKAAPRPSHLEDALDDRKERRLIARDWIVCFLRAPWGSWTLGGDTGRTLVYLFYNCNSGLIDHQPAKFTTVVAYKAPALPTPPLPDLADWACTLDPYLAVKGSALAQEHLALAGRHPQPARS